MRNFSIFHSRGGAANIRAIQIGNYLHAKLNPRHDYEKDTCIYVKIYPHEPHPENSYYDVVDTPKAVTWLAEHPDDKIKVIAISLTAKEWIAKVLNRDDILCIPHHHCNYERWVRPDRPVVNVGVIGSKTSLQHPVEDMKNRLKEIGLNLMYDIDHWEHYNNLPNHEGKDSREKVCRFYKQIDIQIVWRPKSVSEKFAKLRSPLKLENAASFGIPTVAFAEEDYVAEWGDNFIGVNTIDSLIYFVKRLKDEHYLYWKMATRGMKKAEEYHIEHISKLYLNL